MKKVALSLLALALVGAGAFAQEAPALKIGGYLDMGTLTTLKSDAGNQTIVKGDDSGKVGGSYEFRLAYGTAKSGLVLNVRLESLAGGQTVYNAQDAFSWFLLPGIDAVKVKAGQFGNAGLAWNQLDDKGDKQGNGLGVAVEVTPTDGFTAGGSYLPPTANTVTAGTSALGVIGAGATYTVPSTAQVVFGLATGTNTSSATAVDNVAASFKLLMDGPLSAKGGFNMYTLAYDKKSYGTDILDVTVGYAVTDAFSVGLLTYVYLYGSDVKDGSDAAAVSYKINPYVNYTVDPVTSVGFGGTYFQGATDKAYNSDGTANVAPLNKQSHFEINPNATFTIDANQKVLVNYLYDSFAGDQKPQKDASYSTIKVDYRYTF